MLYYIDPGTGSMLFTVLLGIIGAGVYSLRMLFIKLRYKLGGGKVQIVRINQVKVVFTGEYSAVIVIHHDKPGVIAHITKCLSDRNVNIAFMRLFLEKKGHTAYSIVESDGNLPEDVTASLLENPNVHDVMIVQI